MDDQYANRRKTIKWFETVDKNKKRLLTGAFLVGYVNPDYPLTFAM
jgi:hypothetical protein